MEKFIDKIKCRHCNSEYYKEIRSEDIETNNQNEYYISCDYCRQKIILKSRMYKVKFYYQNFYESIGEISLYEAVKHFIEDIHLQIFNNCKHMIQVKER